MDRSVMRVGYIRIEEDRAVFKRDPEADYHVIGTVAAGQQVKIGDKIVYEPYGVNFGWLEEGAG